MVLGVDSTKYALSLIDRAHYSIRRCGCYKRSNWFIVRPNLSIRAPNQQFRYCRLQSSHQFIVEPFITWSSVHPRPFPSPSISKPTAALVSPRLCSTDIRVVCRRCLLMRLWTSRSSSTSPRSLGLGGRSASGEHVNGDDQLCGAGLPSKVLHKSRHVCRRGLVCSSPSGPLVSAQRAGLLPALARALLVPGGDAV